MSNTNLIKELRALTQAGMKDCKEALEEANWDLQKAVDIVKVKGLNIADGRSGRVAAEGIVVVGGSVVPNVKTLLEVNCQTDFVAQSKDFLDFTSLVSLILSGTGHPFQHDHPALEIARKAVISSTKENIVIRRWWVEEALGPNVRIFSYIHSNNKIGVLLTLQGANVNNPDFVALGENLAMQIAAMNPLAVSVDRLAPEAVERQRAIFETQLQELNKPQVSWPKIMEGKMRRWYSEVCLLNQQSIFIQKNTVEQVIKDTESKLGGSITIINFIRCRVGDGLDIPTKSSFVEDVQQLSGGND